MSDRTQRVIRSGRRYPCKYCPAALQMVDNRGPDLVAIVPSPYFDVRVSGSVMAAAPGIAQAGKTLAPAEELQADDEQPVITIRFGLALAAISAAVLVGHLVWVRAGMPVPAFLSPVLEMLNV